MIPLLMMAVVEKSLTTEGRELPSNDTVSELALLAIFIVSSWSNQKRTAVDDAAVFPFIVTDNLNYMSAIYFAYHNFL